MESQLFFNAAVTVDIVIFTLNNTSALLEESPEDKLQVLLIKRRNSPHKDKWAIPGGFIEADETLEESARRELFEETNVKDIPLYQFYSFGDPGRDPRGRVITVAFYTIIKKESINPVGGDDALEARWFDFDKLPSLAFDHDKVLKYAYNTLQKKQTIME